MNGMQKTLLSGMMGAVLMAADGCGLSTAASPAAHTHPAGHVTQPSAQVLAKYGMHVRLADVKPPISRTQAAAIVKRRWPLPHRTPVAMELVLFSDPHVIALRTPQLAWLVTWNATSSPVGGPAPSKPSGARTGAITYHHMNEVLSAKTGKFLEAFPSS